MTITKKLTLACVATILACAVVGCGEKSRAEMRPDMDKVVSDEHGLQSRDLREMTDRLAPDLLTIPEITQSPYRVTIVVKSIDNKTEDMPGHDLDIYVHRLAGLLNQAPTRDRLLFVEQKAVLEKMQNEELGGTPGTATPGDTRIKPQYALYGTISSMDNNKTTYYYCEFKLTSLLTGAEVWQGHYEVRTLN